MDEYSLREILQMLSIFFPVSFLCSFETAIPGHGDITDKEGFIERAS